MYRVIAAILLLSLSAMAHSEVVVIGNKDSSVGSLGEDQVAELFLGKAAKLPDGTVAEVADLSVGNPVRDEFSNKVLHKTERQLRAYWAKRVFTGKGTPPATLPDEQAVVDWVAAGKGRLGYISGKAVSDKVKILLRMP
ncbi:MAG: phosphate ABC transporter substrate-binding protein [Gammaproteobacteria bacterium]